MMVERRSRSQALTKEDKKEERRARIRDIDMGVPSAVSLPVRLNKHLCRDCGSHWTHTPGQYVTLFFAFRGPFGEPRRWDCFPRRQSHQLQRETRYGVILKYLVPVRNVDDLLYTYVLNKL